MVDMPGKGGILNDTCANNLCSEERASSVNTDEDWKDRCFVNKTKQQYAKN